MIHPPAPLLSVLLIAVSACAAAPVESAQSPADTDDAHQWLERIEQRAAEIETLRARLRYERVQGLLGDRQTRFGDLHYDAGPPQRFAIKFDRLVVDNALREHHRHYIFDGRWLAEIQHDHKLFIRRELVPEDATDEELVGLDDGPFVLPLDLEKDKVLERFEVAVIERNAGEDEELDNTVHLRLTARPGVDVQQDRLDVWYDRDTRLPVRVRGEERGEDEHWILQFIESDTGTESERAVFDTDPPDEAGWQVEINPLDE